MAETERRKFKILNSGKVRCSRSPRKYKRLEECVVCSLFDVKTPLYVFCDHPKPPELPITSGRARYLRGLLNRIQQIPINLTVEIDGFTFAPNPKYTFLKVGGDWCFLKNGMIRQIGLDQQHAIDARRQALHEGLITPRQGVI